MNDLRVVHVFLFCPYWSGLTAFVVGCYEKERKQTSQRQTQATQQGFEIVSQCENIIPYPQESITWKQILNYNEMMLIVEDRFLSNKTDICYNLEKLNRSKIISQMPI